ncbi:MAG: HAMP domain-containing histidine kinase [Phycisphaerae bacterium]|nr:HAMP domain-containing histidine kinase [Phycisphaerae bacterium]
MYRRFAVLAAIILAAVAGLSGLGYHAIDMRARGLEGERLGEFAAVAEQIRRDVKRKLDEFIRREQKRPYTDYRYYYVPENVATVQQEMPLLRSPLGERLEHGLAYGFFQIEPNGAVAGPYPPADPQQTIRDKRRTEIEALLANVGANLLPALGPESGQVQTVDQPPLPQPQAEPPRVNHDQQEQIQTPPPQPQKSAAKVNRVRQQKLEVGTLNERKPAQVYTQQRAIAESNVEPYQRTDVPSQHLAKELPLAQMRDSLSLHENQAGGPDVIPNQPADAAKPTDVVQVRVEPFVPILTSGGPTDSWLGGQVFLVRHVQIDSRHFVQGFLLNEAKLIEEVRESASRFVREGMRIDLATEPDPAAAYAAVLDFGFGELAVNLAESDPDRIARQIRQLRFWYLGIVAVAVAAVSLGLTGFWAGIRRQMDLSKKKDNFISAVSHELRTPLTSIRMYTEMLKKNWVRSQDKRDEYYRSMHQETERLSRLVENVLDFSRIQRGRKRYDFRLGDLNECVSRALEMMAPQVRQAGFVLRPDLTDMATVAFDHDAVTQVVVNLVDNALKYARDAHDKTITVRTRRTDGYVLIEVEDRGPGVPHHQRKKVFDEFYRCEDESRRETTGVGLGLALVKRLAEAHRGSVEILPAKPTGALIRVALAAG